MMAADRGALREAWDGESAELIKRRHERPGPAASLRDGLAKTLTVRRRRYRRWPAFHVAREAKVA